MSQPKREVQPSPTVRAEQTNNSSFRPESAQAIVREAAADVGLDNRMLLSLEAKMEQHLIVEPWVLVQMEWAQWRDLGAPIGLAAAVKRRMAMLDADNKSQYHDDVSRTPLQTPQKEGDTFGPRYHTTTTWWDDPSPLSLKRTLGPKFIPMEEEMETVTDCSSFMDDGAPLQSARCETSAGKKTDSCPTPPATRPHDPAIDDDETPSQKQCEHELEMPGIVERFRTLLAITKWIDWLVPFDHQHTWKRGTLHAMPSKHLQQYVLNTAEVWFVFMALFVGACTALWATFPLEIEDPSLAPAMVVSNVFSCVTTLCCLGGLVLFGVVYVVASAVHPSRFKKFFLFVIPTLQMAEYFLVASFYLFLVTLLLCCYVRNAVATADSGIEPLSATLMSFIVAVFALIIGATFYNINFLGRVAFHGKFMLEEYRRGERDSAAAMRTRARTAYDFECEETMKALRTITKSEEDVLNKFMLQAKREKLKHRAPDGIRFALGYRSVSAMQA